MTSEIDAKLAAHLLAFNLAFARHEARIMEINANQRQANQAAMLVIEDALDRLHAMQGQAR